MGPHLLVFFICAAIPVEFVLATEVCGDLLHDKSSPPRRLHAFRSSCYEFVEESLDWFQAEDACQDRGGELLDLVDSKGFLQSLKEGILESTLTWWLGQGVEEKDRVPPMGEPRTPLLTVLCVDASVCYYDHKHIIYCTRD